MDDARKVLDDLRDPVRELRDHIPDVWSAYAHIHRAAMAEGDLSAKAKELIALAVAVTRQCDGSIASHARGAARAGATPQEVAEALGVAVMLNGGPGMVWGPRAYQAYLAFAAGAGDAEQPDHTH
jgi:AhpD family alkylhydroperoxidase